MNNYDTVYNESVVKMRSELDRLGSWKYYGNDSIWKKDLISFNLNLLNSVIDGLKPLEREWDSLIFIGEKYESIPLPSLDILDERQAVLDDKILVLKFRTDIEGLVAFGAFDRDGHDLRVDVSSKLKRLDELSREIDRLSKSTDSNNPIIINLTKHRDSLREQL